MIKNNDIICFGFADWDNPFKTNQHHIMVRLAKYNRVLFIESLGLRRPIFQKKDIFRIFKRLIKGIIGVRKINNNLYIFSPLVIPFHKFDIIRKINKFLLSNKLKRIVKKLGFSKPILWSYIPSIVEFIDIFDKKLLVYHCVDELAASPLIPSKVVKNLEEKLLKIADIVFVSSKPLYEKKRSKNVYYLANVADFDHFYQVAYKNLLIPHDILKIKHPIIGFIGAISKYKLDFDIIKYIVEIHKDWSVVLVGPLGEGEKEFKIKSFTNLFKNLYYLGPKPYSILPHYLAQFDVCILPIIKSEFTKYMFPLKFFEYLSTGKPLVAIETDAIKDFKNYFYAANDKYEFVRQIEKALSEDLIKKQQRIEIAKNFSWTKRMEEISNILEKFL